MRSQIQRTFVFAAFLVASFVAYAQANVRRHTVEEGQTLYSIARLYHISPNELMKLNPQAGDLIKPGDVLVLPENASREGNGAVAQGPGAQFIGTQAGAQQPEATKCREMYQIQKKDNLYRLAQKYGLDIEEIVAANPGLTSESKLKKGEWLCIPFSKAELQAEAEQRRAAEQAAAEQLAEQMRQARKENHLDIAVVLPLKEKTERGGKMVEFYQGLLMAVDSVRKQGTSIDVYAYHSGDGVDGINAVLEKEEMKQMDVVFGPVDGVQANILNSFCQQHGVRLVMPFATTSAYGARNPHAYITSLQASAINKAGAELVAQRFKQHNIVILSAGASDNRGSDFALQLDAALTAAGLSARSLDIEELSLSFASTLSKTRTNLIVLNSSAQSAVQKTAYVLKAFIQEHPEYKISLLGFPEWTTYQGSILKNFHELDTYIYATFYRNPNAPQVRQFEQQFFTNFNAELIRTTPRYGMLGMDLGYYFLHGLAQLGSRFDEQQHTLRYSPLQSTFVFTQAEPGKAYVNTQISLVHYAPDGRVEIVGF